MQTQLHGGDIYTKEYRLDFSANINPLGMPESVRRAACRGVTQAANYPDVQCRSLRRAISRGEQVSMEWIVCGNGAAELIFALVQARRPKRALLVSPGFAEYEQALRSVDCEIRFYQCQKEHGFELGEDYPELITEDLDMLFLCNPNNPTGLLIPGELLERIGERCREAGVLMVLDECFNGLLLDGDLRTMKGRLGDWPHLFLLKAFTKLYAMAGLRLGYGLCSNQQVLADIQRVLQPWNVSLPAQLAGEAAMGEQEFAQRSRDYIRQEREYLKGQLRRLGLSVYDSQANYIFFKGPAELYDRCGEQGILIRDCSNYRGLSPGYCRVAVKRREENQELIRVLEAILQPV